MTRLHELRKRFARLRRRRQRIRLSTGLSAILLAVLWIAAVAFLLDYRLVQMSQTQRLVLLAASAAVMIWAFRRYTAPWLGHRETELDMALLVQSQEHIDSDLVAAVQFESPEAPQWGSVQLEHAVIDQVAATGKRLNVMRGVSRRQLARRSLLLMLTAVVWAGVGWNYTDHVSTFLKRFFLLSPAHYPSKTQIESIVIKRHLPLAPSPSETGSGSVTGSNTENESPAPVIDWATVKGEERTVTAPEEPIMVLFEALFGQSTAPGEEPESSKGPIKVLYGQHVRFEVKCSGELPAKGKAVLTFPRSGLRKTLRLEPASGAIVTGSDTVTGSDNDVFVGLVEQLREPLSYQLYVGDAWTDPAELLVTQLPLADVEFEVVPPPYAVIDGGNKSITMPKGLRQISVIEGSRVLVKLSSRSSLSEATLTVVDRTDENRTYAFRKTGQTTDEAWVLDSDESPLRAVTELIRYTIDVTDAEGQHLEQPIIGVIRIQADAPPRIAAAIITQWVLPQARPTIYYRAIDDYAVARVAIACEVTHPDGAVEQKEFDIYPGKPGDPPRRNIEPPEGYPFDLSRLGLNKGDTVAATLRAIDFRGGREGKSAAADPLLFQVTDEQGILAGMMETDGHVAKQLKTMIQRQLGIGESP